MGTSLIMSVIMSKKFSLLAIAAFVYASPLTSAESWAEPEDIIIPEADPSMMVTQLSSSASGKSSCKIQPGLYKIVTSALHAGASARQPSGWGLSAWHAHGAARNSASSWAAVHSGSYWPMVWNIQPAKRTKGAYTIKTTSKGPKKGKQPAGWGLSAWHAHGAVRNSASSRVAVHAGNHWLMDWRICQSKRTKGTYTIKTSGVHSKTSAKQPAGWGLSAWMKHGGKRNNWSAWAYVHSGNHWLMDWKLVKVGGKRPLRRRL